MFVRPFMDLASESDRCGGLGFHIDDVSLNVIDAFGYSPVYITSLSSVSDRANRFVELLREQFLHSTVFYAMKANPSAPIVQACYQSGCGVEIVSLGEWNIAIHSGVAPSRICFSGAAKRDDEWITTIEDGLGFFNAEHLEEMKNVLDYLYTRSYTHTNVAIRINPALQVETHPHLRTGALDSKFGVLAEHFFEWLKGQRTRFSSHEAWQQWSAPLCGIHIHAGSQIQHGQLLQGVVQAAFDVYDVMIQEGLRPKQLDFGGGLAVAEGGVPHDGHDIKEFVTSLSQCVNDQIGKRKDQTDGDLLRQLQIAVEPGRSLVASSSIFLCRVLYLKQNSPNHRFAFLDGGMNDFPRPAIYGARHAVQVVNFDTPSQSPSEECYILVGPVCESADTLARDVKLKTLHRGDRVAFFEAGAYCSSMASRYNSRQLPAEIFVRRGEIVAVRAPD